MKLYLYDHCPFCVRAAMGESLNIARLLDTRGTAERIIRPAQQHEQIHPYYFDRAI